MSDKVCINCKHFSVFNLRCTLKGYPSEYYKTCGSFSNVNCNNNSNSNNYVYNQDVSDNYSEDNLKKMIDELIEEVFTKD
jgi:hypothetical protein